MYSEAWAVADAGQCRPKAALDLKSVRIESTQRLVAVDIHPDGTITTQNVEQNSAAGPATTASLVATMPTGDIIPGDGDTGQGNFLAVRRVTSNWGDKIPAQVDELEYRISADREVLYRFQVPLDPDGAHSVTLLGEDRIGFTSRGKTVIAFDQDTGQEKWRWEGKNPWVVPDAALKGGEVLDRVGEHYVIVKNGKQEDQRDEGFMLFVMKFRCPDEDD